MLSDVRDPDLSGALAAAVAGVPRALRDGPAAAVLLCNGGPSVEVIHQNGLPPDLYRALSNGGGERLGVLVRRSGHPLRLDVAEPPDDMDDIVDALRAHSISALAVLPLLGEADIVGYLAAPLDPTAGEALAEGWWAACRAPAGLQVAAGATALRVMLAEDRRRQVELSHGVVVVDRWGRVLLAHGVLRGLPGWNGSDLFGRPLDGLPGGSSLTGLKLSAPGSLVWERHVLPPGEAGAVPLELSAVPGRLIEEALDGSRVVLVRDLRAGTGEEADATGTALELGYRVANAAEQFLGVLEERAEPRSDDPPALLMALGAEAHRARVVVKELLERTVSEDARGQIDVNRALSSTIEALGPTLARTDVRVLSFLKNDLAPVPGDPIRLRRALQLLLTRARDRLRDRGGAITVRSWSEAPWVYVSVSDDGGGAASVPGVEPLFPDVEDECEVAEIRSIVDRHGGRVHSECRPGVWNRFTLMLPAERRRRRIPEPSKVGTAQGGRPSGLEILVVDDNPSLRKVLRRFLERRGHAVTEAEGAGQALALMDGRDFDGVLVDVNMPAKSGPEMYREMERVAPGLRERVVFMTGGFLDDAVEAFITESGRPAAKKPFDLAALARLVEGRGR